MNKPIHNNQINKILLKPRFKIEVNESEEDILNKFKDALGNKEYKYRGKIINHHIIIDVSDKEDHFWSPQLHVEIEKDENKKTIVKGVLGPKPQVWTFFMFLHFAVFVAFFVFLVIFYTNWSLNQDFYFAMIMCIIMPIVWVVLYFVGQLGKKFGYNQMVELHEFLMNTVQKRD